MIDPALLAAIVVGVIGLAMIVGAMIAAWSDRE